MKAFGYLAAAAVASVLSMAPSLAHATASDDLKNAALALVTAGTNTGNGGSFNTKVFKNAFTYSNTQFSYLFGSSTLTAADWYDEITAGTYFTEKTNIADIAAGQFFAIDVVYDDPATPDNEAYAGHSGVVLGAPVDITPPTEFYGPIVSGTRQYALSVADSTSSVHGVNASFPDSRNSTSPAGVNKPGTAYIRLYTDAATGEILAYTWSVTNSNNLAGHYEQSERPFAFGYLAAKPL
jgi:hypothetical protein